MVALRPRHGSQLIIRRVWLSHLVQDSVTSHQFKMHTCFYSDHMARISVRFQKEQKYTSSHIIFGRNSLLTTNTSNNFDVLDNFTDVRKATWALTNTLHMAFTPFVFSMNWKHVCAITTASHLNESHVIQGPRVLTVPAPDWNLWNSHKGLASKQLLIQSNHIIHCT